MQHKKCFTGRAARLVPVLAVASPHWGKMAGPEQRHRRRPVWGALHRLLHLLRSQKACDPNFKNRLRERRKKQKLAKERAGLSKLPDLKDAEAVQKFFLEAIQLGEELLAQGDVRKAWTIWQTQLLFVDSHRSCCKCYSKLFHHQCSRCFWLSSQQLENCECSELGWRWCGMRNKRQHNKISDKKC